jgi:predicted TPR repeat methyltransferase
LNHDHHDDPSAGAGGVLEHGPSDAQIAEWLSQAMGCHGRGNLSEAQTGYERILAHRPNYPEVLNFLGILQQQRGQSVQAELLIRRAIASAPGYAAAYTNLGNVLLIQGRHEDAIAAYRQAIRFKPDEVEACVNLGAVLRGLGRLPEALDAYQQASRWRPADANIHYHRGLILADLDRLEEAIQAQRTTLEHHAAHLGAVRALGTLLYQRGELDEARVVFGNAVFQLGEAEEALKLLQYWLRLMPDDPIARHRLAAWFSEETPARASDGYVTYLFDRYADCFDEHLVEQLDYQAPAVIGARLADLLGTPTAQFEVLDAGCGTGLCQPVLRPYARRLTGIDLSPRMIEKARARGGYDELAVAELTEFLNERPGAYDLIVSADTLVYFGALESVLTAAARALRPGGWLAFTAEQISADRAPDGYFLNKSGRYSHTAEYLERALAAAGLELLTRTDATLRQEDDQPVVGHVTLAHKPAATIDG